VQRLLKTATSECDNPDIRDRAYVYWRLLSASGQVAKDVVLSEKPPINANQQTLSQRMLDELVQDLGSLASVYHKPKDSFVGKGRFGADAVQRRAIEYVPSTRVTLGNRSRMHRKIQSRHKRNQMSRIFSIWISEGPRKKLSRRQLSPIRQRPTSWSLWVGWRFPTPLLKSHLHHLNNIRRSHRLPPQQTTWTISSVYSAVHQPAKPPISLPGTTYGAISLNKTGRNKINQTRIF
jgi:hypothetical protein